MEDSVPATLVATDITRTHSSNGEISLVQELNTKGRSFDYVMIDSSLYPEEDVISYALSNPEPFMQAGLYSVTVATEEEANAIISSIENGEKTLLEAADESQVTTDGDLGNVFRFTLENNLVNADDAATVFSLAEGEMSSPIQTYEGYTVYQLVSAAHMPTAPSDEEFDEARSYIATAESGMMNAYLDERAAEFSARIDAGEDFFTVAEETGLSVTTVASTTPNPSGFPLFSSFQMTDPNSGLTNATYFNTEYINTLYQSDEGTVLPAETLTSGARLITRVGAEESANTDSTYISTMYSYIKPQMALTDLQEAIFRDPSFEDNFASVFFTQLMGSTN